MFLELDRWNDAYAQIVRDCCSGQQQGGGGRSRTAFLVVAATSVDAVCASRIWTYWLRADGISYELLAADQWNVIQKRLFAGEEEERGGGGQSSYGACVLFNLGATVNLTRVLMTPLPGGRGGNHPLPCRVYVVDGRRPIHLANVYDRENIVVLGDRLGSNGNGADQDDDDNDDEIPSDGDNLSGNESSTDDEEDDDDDDEEEDDDEQSEDTDDGEHEFQDNELARKPEPQQDDLPEDGDDYSGDDEREQDDENSIQKAKRQRQLADSDDIDDPMNITAATVETALTEEATTMDDDDDDHHHLDDMNDNKSSSSSPSTTAPPMTVPTLTPRELHRHRRARLRRYYARGTYHGAPSSFVAWHMTSQSRFAQTADLLWLAITGVAGAFWYHQLDRTGYETLAAHLKQDCQILFPTDQYHRSGSSTTVYAEHLIANPDNPSSTTRTKIGVSENGRILAEPEFRFFLLRQSSLYQAICHSEYVATQWQLTTTTGRLKLNEWLATMGFPLFDCQQPFGLVKPTLRRRLQSAVRESASHYGLDDLEVPGFFRVTGFQSLLSAADAAHAIAALLAVPPPTGPQHGQDERTQDHSLSNEPSAIQKSFQLAFDALNYQDADSQNNSNHNTNNNTMANLVNGSLSGGHTATGIAGGFRLATQLQQAIQTAAASLMDRRAITRLSHFRYAYITCSSNKSRNRNQQQQRSGNQPSSSSTNGGTNAQAKFHVFAQPLVLTRLAHYLMDWHRASNQWTGAKARPLILCAQDPQTLTYTVVGQVYPPEVGSLVRNNLGQYFALAAETLNSAATTAQTRSNGDIQDDDDEQSTEGAAKMAATVRLDYSMDSHIVQVADTHVQRFIEQLHYLMDSV